MSTSSFPCTRRSPLRWTQCAVTYYVAPEDHGGGPGGFGGKQHSDIGDWVAATFAPIKVGSDTVYDLTVPAK